MQVVFPEPAWVKLYEYLHGYELKNELLQDDIFFIDNYVYDFKFEYKGCQGRFTAKDFTHLNRSDLRREYHLKIGFQYINTPDVEISVFKKSMFFAFLNTLLRKNVSLKNTPLQGKFLFQSSSPKLCNSMVPHLYSMATIENNWYISNDHVDPKTGGYSLDFTSSIWLNDYQAILDIVEKMYFIFKESIVIETREDLL